MSVSLSAKTNLQEGGQSHLHSSSWYFQGLERFVNAGDGEEDYRALAGEWPTLWPFPLEDGEGNDLSWSEYAHGLFLYFRNILRRLWARDPRVMRDGFHLDLLLGTISSTEIEAILTNRVHFDPDLDLAIGPLRNSCGKLRLRTAGTGGGLPLAHFWPDWGSGAIRYVSHIDFQHAIWRIFRESWRTKVCPHCSRYFIAQKSAQMYCSSDCSRAAHQESSLRWWREKGSHRRASTKTRKVQSRRRKGGRK